MWIAIEVSMVYIESEEGLVLRKMHSCVMKPVRIGNNNSNLQLQGNWQHSETNQIIKAQLQQSRDLLKLKITHYYVSAILM